MDVVSVVSSIAGLVTLALQIGGALNDYVQAVEGHSFEVQSLYQEITLLAEVLSQLKDVFSAKTQGDVLLDRDCVLRSAITDCTRRIEKVGAKIRPSTGGKLARSLDKLKWPFERGEVEKLALGLQRFTQTFSFALTAKGFQVLTKSAQDASASLEQLLDMNKKMTAMYEQMQISTAETAKESAQMQQILTLLPLLMEHSNDIREMSHHLRLAEEREHERRKDEILEWLLPRSATMRHAEASKRRTSQTCFWFERQPAVQQWLRPETSTHDLLCVGHPGVGKTVLAAFIVDRLRLRHKDTGVVVLHYYCSHFDEQTSSAVHFGRSLLRQLCQLCTRVPVAVADFYRQTKHETDDALWFQTLEAVLLRVISTFDHIYLVLDALDEVNTARSRQAILSLLTRAREANKSIHVMATARPHVHDLDRCFHYPLTIQITASAEDIRNHLLTRINEDSQAELLLDSALKTEIVDTLSAAANGVFLLPTLQLDQILQQVSRAGVRRSLANLSGSLDDAFGVSLERIRGLPPLHKDLASQTLMWLSSVHCPLTMGELQHALAVQDDDVELDRDNLVAGRIIIENCSGLVELDQETGVVKLVHFSLEEYLQSHDHGLFRDADSVIATKCLRYISYPSLKQLTALSRPRFAAALATLPFLRYAATEWGHHARKARLDSYAKLAVEVLDKSMNMLAVAKARDSETPDDSRWLERVTSWAFSGGAGVSLCASFGLVDLLRVLLLKTDATVLNRCRNAWGSLPLHEAARSGNHEVCELLVTHGADVMARDGHGATPFYLAIAKGHLETAKILLKYNRAALDTHCRKGWTALHKAADLGLEEVLAFLLEAGALVAARSADRSTALHICCRRGDLVTAKLLVHAGADLNATSWEQAPIDLAALSGNADLVSHLIEHGAKIDEVGRDQWTTLFRACRRGHAAVIAILLKCGADMHYRDRKRTNCLHMAARSGNLEAVKTVLEHCGDYKLTFLQQGDKTDTVPRQVAFFCAHFHIHKHLRNLEHELLSAASSATKPSQIFDLGQPMALAIEARDLSLVKSIVTTEPHLVNRRENTQQLLPIHLAFIEKDVEIVSHLLDNGASIDSAAYHGWQPLHIAASVGSVSLIELALSRGAKIDAVTESLQTPLHKAASSKSLEALRAILDAGADPWARNSTGMTPLHAAASNGFFDGLRELLKPEWHAEDTLYVRDRNGKLPRDWAELRGELEAASFLQTREKMLKALDRPRSSDNLSCAVEGEGTSNGDRTRTWTGKTRRMSGRSWLHSRPGAHSRPQTPEQSLSRAETLVESPRGANNGSQDEEWEGDIAKLAIRFGSD